MPRASRRHPSILVLLLALRLGVSAPVGAEGAIPAAPTGTPGGATAIPATPVGDQLAWVLDQLNGAAASLSEADIVAHAAPRFLAEVPAPVVLDLLRQTAAAYAPVGFVGFAYPPTPTRAIALVVAGTGERGALALAVEAAPPHRITRLDLGEPPAPPSPTGRRVDVGGRALFLDCTGTGKPTVVLEGGISSDWAAVQPAVAAVTRVCSYDRPDSPASHSDPTPVRTAQEVVADLRALLGAAGEAGPYVLVGHSMGGLYVQLYAYQHPDEVGGLVLVDPTPEEFGARLADLLASLGTPVPATAGEPNAEQISFAQMRAARAAGTLPSVPLVVLSHGRAPAADERPPGWPIAAEEQLLRDLHEEIARLVPNGRHVVAEGSGHDIHMEQPDLVVEAIREVVAAVRDPSTWGTPAPGTLAPSPPASPGARHGLRVKRSDAPATSRFGIPT
jgi:pimeloyl-ACP methyl ester carboxylesterase